MKNILLNISFILVLLSLQSFRLAHPVANEIEYELEVKIDGQDVKTTITSLYSKFEFCDEVLSEEVFERGVSGYLYLKHTGQLENDR